MHEKTREILGIAVAVGIRNGRARRSRAGRMVKPRLMARHRRFDRLRRGVGSRVAGKRDWLVALARETTRLKERFVAARSIRKAKKLFRFEFGKRATDVMNDMAATEGQEQPAICDERKARALDRAVL
jgi:preprotein translocase subunit SecA